MACHVGPGQFVPGVVSPLGQVVHGAAPGVPDPQHPGHLVKALPRRVVPGPAQDLHIRVGSHVHDQSSAAGDAQTYKGGLQIWMGDVVGSDVSPHMVHRDQRTVQRHGRPLGKVHPHQHRPDEPRGVGNRNGIQLSLGQARLGYRLFRQSGNRLHMLPGGDLRHHAPIDGVHLDLRCNTVGQHRPSVPDHRGSGLVTGGLDG